ncbi:hypothetical protein MFMK1_001880 [Metallumcola ferriviriculae]|uniref:Nucleotidase n=1 Tax=Metallumcola ferriviriculae TaxID=3039180 RepID=A0AAU0UMP6_9FIRM|nr:hypothetical protein MFMK1_001880 [Desulfitibacteraceae bacterium MK1]
MKIGVDIDGVINDILTICVEKLNQHLDKELSVHDISDYDLSKCYQVTYQEMQDFFVKEEESILESVVPQPTAAAILKELIDCHRVTLITARPASQRQVTAGWLKKHGIPYDKLITIGSHDKREACLEEQVDIFIEDRLENALMINGMGIPVLLMDAPHNKGKLPDGIKRVFSWQDIRAELSADTIGKFKLGKNIAKIAEKD